MFANPLGDFGFDGRREHRLSTLAKHLGQHVATRGWKRNRRCGNFLHGGVLLGKMVFENNQIQTQVRRLLQLLIHNFWLYLINVMRNASCCCKPAEARPLAGKSAHLSEQPLLFRTTTRPITPRVTGLPQHMARPPLPDLLRPQTTTHLRDHATTSLEFNSPTESNPNKPPSDKHRYPQKVTILPHTRRADRENHSRNPSTLLSPSKRQID